jgi:proteasome lid subunit RPN8/RPN11
MGNPSGGGLATPVFLKTAEDMGWPKGKRTFYLLTADGLFICRDHPFFRSSVLARGWPSELAHHREFLRLSYPKVPRRLLELCVGFFGCMADAWSAEAAVILVWDERVRRVRLIVPDQVSKCRRTYSGSLYGLSVHYEVPALPAHLAVIGDVHSHVDGQAYASYADRDDETYRPGLHIVCGRIDREPPQFHVDAVVDGVRFTVASDRVLEGYRRRRSGVPKEWLRRVKIEIDDPYRRSSKTSYGRGNDYDSTPRAGSYSSAPASPSSSASASSSSGSYFDRYYGDTPLADPRRYDEVTSTKSGRGDNGDGAAGNPGDRGADAAARPAAEDSHPDKPDKKKGADDAPKG